MPVLSIVLLAALVVALIDIIMRDESQVKHLPKVVWILLVVLLPLVGTVLWFALGREYEGAERAVRVRRQPAQQPAANPPNAVRHDTRSTEQQLADLEREIEEDRLRAEAERRRRSAD